MENNENILDLRICSNAANVCCTAKQVIEFVKNKLGDVNPDSLFEIKVILNELLTNAVFHGNQNIEAKCVKLMVMLMQDFTIQIKVEDEGEGFNHLVFEGSNKFLDCMETDSIKECGRGLSIVKSLGNNVSFNEKGNGIIVMYKLKQ